MSALRRAGGFLAAVVLEVGPLLPRILNAGFGHRAGPGAAQATCSLQKNTHKPMPTSALQRANQGYPVTACPVRRVPRGPAMGGSEWAGYGSFAKKLLADLARQAHHVVGRNVQNPRLIASAASCWSAYPTPAGSGAMCQWT
jgi:hypothetical protein